ncbi:hypothetical protein LSAT2_026520 [Lamellibrachia satsuma]|nr:hypothetical protein LSAT2_026520 [Lamellibrachia satsuma]
MWAGASVDRRLTNALGTMKASRATMGATSSSHVAAVTQRVFSTSSCVFSRKTLIPFDDRFELNPKDVGPHRKGGSTKLARYLGRRSVAAQMPGYEDKNGKFVFVPEMVPEFIVPDLTHFKLKPYVSYKVTDVTQTEFTAKDLFDAIYGQELVKKCHDGKVDPDSLLEPGTLEKVISVK